MKFSFFQNIYQNFDASEFHAAEFNALNRALLQHFGRALDLLALKTLAKAQARVSISDISVLFNIQFDKFDSYEKVIMLYGFFNSTKTLSTGRDELFELCLRLLIESARKLREEEENDYLFLLSIENMTSFFKFYGTDESLERLQRVWAMVNLYLESTMIGIRDRLLILVGKLVKNRGFVVDILLPEMLERPWIDRNKYYVLAELLNEQKFPTLAETRDPNMGDLFFQGLCLSLKYRHLFSPGQALVKVLLKQEVPMMRETIANIFIFGSVHEKKHMIEQWSCSWTAADKDAIFGHIYARCDFDAIVQTARVENEIFGHLVVLRNAFARQFSAHGFDNASIDGVIREKWLSMSDGHFIECQVYEIFVENVHSNMEIAESLTFLRRFIQTRYVVQDSGFRQNLLKKLPHLLQHLAKSSPTFDTFFTFIHELFLSGVQSDIYQHQIFAVKLFQTVLGLFKSHEQLKILHWDLESNIHHEALMTLATTSDFDDVRNLSYDLLSRYLSHSQATEINPNLYNLPYPNFKVRFMIDTATDNHEPIREWFRGALDVTENSLQQMKHDPLNAVKNEVNLFKPLDCFNEFFLNDKIRLEAMENDGELIELVKCVADVIIDLINSKEQGLDFSKLDENLELLVEQSQVRSAHVDKDKKKLLHSFWHTLRVSILF